MLPFRLVSAVMCDDVRQEGNGKAILIGVYNGVLVVPGFPAEILSTWWLQISAQQIGQFEMDVQVVQDNAATLVRALAGFNIPTRDPAAIVVPKMPLHLHLPGHFKLQMKLKGDTDWSTIYEFEVKAGQVPGAIEQVVGQQPAA